MTGAENVSADRAEASRRAILPRTRAGESAAQRLRRDRQQANRRRPKKPLSRAGAMARAPRPGRGAAMTDRDDRIRELAYFLWLEEGCPEGQAERHWETAETLFDSEHRRGIEGE